MTELKALIIAAGRGIRMGPRGELTPKGLISVAGTPLVQRSVRLLQERGIQSVRIVTGHLADQYNAAFEDVDGVELVHNPLYATTGSLRSLMTGLEDLQGPFLLLESDLIYERAALDPVVAHHSRIWVSGPTDTGDEYYTWARSSEAGNPVLDTMSKDAAAHDRDHYGEFVGLSCYSPEGTEALKSIAEACLSANPKSEYELAMIRLSKDHDVDCHLIPDLVWTEIDDEVMYAHATDDIWPLIQKRDGRC
ncbi:Choline kinase [Shimia gijangensis]|uniref:Choline kinase n=1 Tax=Shimia gijangensis TaxID=1470563 RepID=A0A1M6JT45_9RHOB|nr:phosphocholine cytidylyltransferase family protein [Shimia gijangensis]SHJ49859.1 Choline kinase [Shimia gijangensis]